MVYFKTLMAINKFIHLFLLRSGAWESHSKTSFQNMLMFALGFRILPCCRKCSHVFIYEYVHIFLIFHVWTMVVANIYPRLYQFLAHNLNKPTKKTTTISEGSTKIRSIWCPMIESVTCQGMITSHLDLFCIHYTQIYPHTHSHIELSSAVMHPNRLTQWLNWKNVVKSCNFFFSGTVL